MGNDHLGIGLYSVAHKLLRFVRRGQANSGISTERVLLLLTLHEVREASIKDLAEIEHVAHSTMSRLISGLAQDGLVTTAYEDTDRRISTVRLTARGRRAVERNLRDLAQPLLAAIAELPAKDAKALRRAVSVLDDVL